MVKQLLVFIVIQFLYAPMVSSMEKDRPAEMAVVKGTIQIRRDKEVVKYVAEYWFEAALKPHLPSSTILLQLAIDQINAQSGFFDEQVYCELRQPNHPTVMLTVVTYPAIIGF